MALAIKRLHNLPPEWP